MAAIESAFGRAIEASDRLPKIVPNAEERDFFAKYDISKEVQNRYANTAAFFTYMQQKYNESFDLLKKYGKKVNKKAFFATHLELYNEWGAVYPCQKVSNVRVLQRKWYAWSEGGLCTLLGNEVKQKNNNCAGKVDVGLKDTTRWNAVVTHVYEYITAQLEECRLKGQSALLSDLADICKTFSAKHYTSTHSNVVYVDCSQVKSKQKLIRFISKEFGLGMHKSKLPFCYWFIAMHLLTSTKKSFSAAELQRQLSQKRLRSYRIRLDKIE